MIDRVPLRGFVTAAVLALALAACQGNIGSGSGLSIPQAPAAYQPGGPGQQTTSRERALEGAVYMSAASPLPDLPLPSVGGFGIDINLGTPAPAPSPTPLATPTPKKVPKRTKTSAVARRSLIALAAPESASAVPSSAAPVTSAAPSGNGSVASGAPVTAPSVSPSGVSSGAAGSPAAAGVTHLSDVPTPSGSGSPGVVSSAGPGTAASPKPGHHTHPAVNAGPKIVTKTVAYPDDAPVAPTPEPTGAIQTFPVRKALVRGYLMPAVDVPIYGLGAIRFFVPKDELTTTRGYTIAVFTAAKKHRGKLLEYDSAPVIGTDSIASTFADDPIVFKKSIGYEIVLYADQGAATPVPIPSGYPAAGNNPFNTPVPSGYTPAPGSSQTPTPYGYATPLPGSSPSPTAFPTFH